MMTSLNTERLVFSSVLLFINLPPLLLSPALSTDASSFYFGYGREEERPLHTSSHPDYATTTIIIQLLPGFAQDGIALLVSSNAIISPITGGTGNRYGDDFPGSPSAFTHYISCLQTR